MIRGPKPKRGVSLLFHRPSCKQSRRNQGDDLTPILPYLQNTRIAAKQHSGHKAAKATCVAQGGNKPRLEICNEMLKMKRPLKHRTGPTPWLRTRSMPMPMTGNIDRDAWFEHYNSVHPHKALGYRSPREFRREFVEETTENAVGAVRRPHDGTAATEAGGSRTEPPQGGARSARPDPGRTGDPP